MGRSADGIGAKIHTPPHQRPELVVHRVRGRKGHYLEVHDAGEHLLQLQQPLHPGRSPGVVDVGVDPDGSGAVGDRPLEGLTATRHDIGHGAGLLGHVRAGEALGDRSGDRGRALVDHHRLVEMGVGVGEAGDGEPAVAVDLCLCRLGDMGLDARDRVADDPDVADLGHPTETDVADDQVHLHPFTVVRPTLSRTPNPLRRPRVAGSWSVRVRRPKTIPAMVSKIPRATPGTGHVPVCQYRVDADSSAALRRGRVRRGRGAAENAAPNPTSRTRTDVQPINYLHCSHETFACLVRLSRCMRGSRSARPDRNSRLGALLTGYDGLGC